MTPRTLKYHYSRTKTIGWTESKFRNTTPFLKPQEVVNIRIFSQIQAIFGVSKLHDGSQVSWDQQGNQRVTYFRAHERLLFSIFLWFTNFLAQAAHPIFFPPFFLRNFLPYFSTFHGFISTFHYFFEEWMKEILRIFMIFTTFDWNCVVILRLLWSAENPVATNIEKMKEKPTKICSQCIGVHTRTDTASSITFSISS